MHRVTFDKNGWPLTMPWLRKRDLTWGEWCDSNDDPDVPQKMAQESECGTRFCAVGWARHAWGLAPSPFAADDGTPEKCLEFQRQLMWNLEDSLGWEHCFEPGDTPTDLELQGELSDLFELGEVEAKQFVKIWRKTVEGFGYTEKA